MTLSNIENSYHGPNKEKLGQFFTYNLNVQKVMLRLVKNKKGLGLEPSAGDGILLKLLTGKFKKINFDAIELDSSIPNISDQAIIYEDFFKWVSTNNKKYNLIFGNPPYVAQKNISPDSKLHMADLLERYTGKANLYQFFIHKAVDLLEEKGELIFIVPKEWLYSTSAKELRSHLSNLGGFTHLIDCGEEKLFTDADVPSIIIFRWEKGYKKEDLMFAKDLDSALNEKWVMSKLKSSNDRWSVLSEKLTKKTEKWGMLGDFYDVKVGLVTGYDKAFKIPKNNMLEESALQKQVDTSRKNAIFINVNHVNTEADIPENTLKHLLLFKNELLSRRISKFDESNWWKYGAVRNSDLMSSKSKRFYSLVKTRSKNPFFNSNAKFFTGGVLGYFDKGRSDIPTKDAVRLLNSVEYREILYSFFFITNDKVSIQPSTIADLPWPTSMLQLREFLDSSDT